MKQLADILIQFDNKQKLTVLIIVLLVNTLTIGLVKYLGTDDCRSIIDENLKLHKTLFEISKITREQYELAYSINVKHSKYSREEYFNTPTDTTVGYTPVIEYEILKEIMVSNNVIIEMIDTAFKELNE